MMLRITAAILAVLAIVPAPALAACGVTLVCAQSDPIWVTFRHDYTLYTSGGSGWAPSPAVVTNDLYVQGGGSDSERCRTLAPLISCKTAPTMVYDLRTVVVYCAYSITTTRSTLAEDQDVKTTTAC